MFRHDALRLSRRALETNIAKYGEARTKSMMDKDGVRRDSLREGLKVKGRVHAGRQLQGMRKRKKKQAPPKRHSSFA